jgi:hypothetical protein
MNDTSRALRYELGNLCQQYNDMVADKDVLDFRLGSPEPYAETTAKVDPERIYERESLALSRDVRRLIADIVEVGRRIRDIEGF